LFTLLSAAALFRVFDGRSWVAAVAVTIVLIHGLCWLLRRGGIGATASAVISAIGIVLITCWTVLGRSTIDGIPTPTTWHQAQSALQTVGDQISTLAAPVPVTHGFQLLAVAGAGVAAALADFAAFRWRAPLLAVVPGLAVFILCSTLGVGRGRATVVGLTVAGLTVFLLVERASGEQGQIWFAGVRSGVGAWIAATGGVAVAAAVVAAMALSPTLPHRDGAGVLGWRGGLGGGPGERIVPNPLVALRTTLTRYANIPVFVVSSSVPSYWRLTSLNTFDGTDWKSTGSYRTFGNRLPGAPPVGTAVRTVRATFRVQQLASVWLPAQFNPVSVEGAKHVTYDPASNSVLISGQTTANLQYTVISYQYLDTINAADLEAARPLRSDPVAAANLQLPTTVNGPITALALSLTRGQTSEYGKALAIQNYLRSPRFVYSLNPPFDGSGTAALYNFLFITRTGYCQQFAGAYAVLARAAGLPTRLAVGFATGQPAPDGTFQVRDKDSHTWPEVYFGPKYGWVPFEPTPGFAVPGTGGYDSTQTANSPGGPANSIPTTVPTTVAPGSNVTTPRIQKNTATSTPSSPAPGTGRHGGSGLSPWWLVVPGLIVAWLAVNGAGPGILRRLRRRRADRAGPDAVALNAWSEVASELMWQGIRRRPYETDDEFAHRASATLRQRGIEPAGTYGGLESLAAMARRATFALDVPEGIGEQASVVAGEVEARLRSNRSPRERLGRVYRPNPGLWGWLSGARKRAGGRAGLGPLDRDLDRGLEPWGGDRAWDRSPAGRR
jgi:transglutaminase-like putative cysteine protease